MALNTSDPHAIKQAAHDILNQPQFASQRQSLWDRVLHYITHPYDLLNLIFNSVAGRVLDAGDHVWLATVFAVIATVVIIFLVLRFSRSATRNNAVHIHYAPTISGKSVKQLLQEAERLEQEENWRDAIRVRYTALIQQLGERGIVRARPGRTTGEYSREVNTNAPSTAVSFSEATRIFEWVWYGKGEPGREDAGKFKTLAADTAKKAAA